MTVLSILLACLLICEVIVATALRIGARLGLLRQRNRRLPSYITGGKS